MKLSFDHQNRSIGSVCEPLLLSPHSWPLFQDMNVYAAFLVSFGKQFLFNYRDYKQLFS